MQDNLESNLLGSSAGLSLRAEVEYVSTLRKLDWETIHSCYYIDHKTDKAREIDVIGMQQWNQKRYKRVVSARVFLIIEAKSLKGYHFLFSPQNDAISTSWRLHSEWIGSEISPFRKHLAKTMADAGLRANYLTQIMAEFQKISYPDDLPNIRRLVVNSPDAPNHASAFRETNIGGEKDLENSVLWRSSQSLLSAVLSLKKDELNSCIKSVANLIEDNIAAEDSPDRFVLDVLTERARTLHLYHPALVIDAPLWMLRDGRLAEIKWCRFEQNSMHVLDDWWFDVVHSSYFSEYAALVSKHYQKQFSKVRAKRL